jgi:hypothetical protein
LKLALGTVQFGRPYGIANQSGQVSRAEAKVILALARSAGIDTLDTAIAYGESETCLGAVGAAGIGVNVHYMPVRLQPYYRNLGFSPGQFPEAEAHGEEANTLPLYSSERGRAGSGGGSR